VGFLSGLYDAFRRINGYAMGAIGVTLTVATYVFAPSTQISLRLLVPIGLLAVLVMFTLGDAAYEAMKRSTRLPKVIRALPPTALYDDARAILLLEPADIFAHDAMVSVFSRSDDFERFIGVGFVATVQENGLIQVCVLADDEDAVDPAWARILQNNRDELSDLLVKPSIPKSMSL
jgi:hypothetical protein